MLEVFNTLLKHLQISVENDLNANSDRKVGSRFAEYSISLKLDQALKEVQRPACFA